MEFTTHFGLHSQVTRLQGILHPPETPSDYGPCTLYGREPQSGGLALRSTFGRAIPKHQIALPTLWDGRLGAGLLPVRSPLLRESQLISFPPLIYMLKFSGLSRLI